MIHVIQALIVDADADRAKDTEFSLQQEGYETKSSRPGHVCLSICRRTPPTIVLLAIDCWQDETINTLIELKSASQTKNIPIIMLSSCDDPKTLIYSLDLGAHQCVQLPIDYCVLSARIRSAVALSRQIRKLEKSNEELLQLASTDALTHVYNRRHFLAQSNTEFARAKRYGRELSIIMIDIDEFKSVNDRYGHAAGDLALISLAECCRKAVRESDIIGRLGGEEFAICCPEADISGAKIIAERLRTACEESLLHYQNHAFCITISLGITNIEHHDKTIEKVMQRADTLLYKAKEAGRNCSVIM